MPHLKISEEGFIAFTRYCIYQPRESYFIVKNYISREMWRSVALF